MAGHDITAPVNHHGPKEAKVVDTFCKLRNLPVAMKSWISRIALQICNWNPNDRGRENWLYAPQRIARSGVSSKVFCIGYHRTDSATTKPEMSWNYGSKKVYWKSTN